MADSVQCTRQGQMLPTGHYNLECMITVAVRRGVPCGACRSRMDARTLSDDTLIIGGLRSSMDELSEWTLREDKL